MKDWKIASEVRKISFVPAKVGAGSNGGIPFDGWGEGGPPIPLSANVKF